MRRWLRRHKRFPHGLPVAAFALAVVITALVAGRFGSERDSHVSPPDKRRPAASVRSTPTPPATNKTATKSPAVRAGSRLPAASERYPSATPLPTPAPPQALAGHDAKPRAAIVIDDLGQNLSHLEQLAGLQIPLSIAVIPGLPATGRTVELAARLGIEILLHQPMEPREETGKNPGQGVLEVAMDATELRAQVRAGIAAVPGAVGVNNHMGSRFTEDAAGLGVLMAELREHNLFWLDSRTTAASLGVAVAREAGVPAIERDIFLDARGDPDFIRGQVRKLIETARRRGTAVSIGHPHPETIAVLRELREELLASGVALVPVSALVHRIPASESGPVLAVTARKKRSGGSPGVPDTTTP